MADEKVRDRLSRVLWLASRCKMDIDNCPNDAFTCEHCINEWIEDLRRAFELDRTIKIEVSVDGHTIPHVKVKG